MPELTQRDYQPSLLWARAQQWAREHAPEGRPEPGPTDLTLQIYRTDATGAYVMHNPKLYWSEDTNASEFTNCDQSALADNAGALGEVVLINRRWRTSELLGATYAEAWERLTARPGPGRPKLSDTETSGTYSIKMPPSLWKKIPGNKSELMRSLIEEWLATQPSAHQ